MADSDRPIALEERANEDARLFSPSAGRNRDVIRDVMSEHLRKNASVLEIASGTGEHGVAMCQKRDDIIWQYSDPDTASRRSQNDWRLDYPDRLLPSLALDTTRPEWWGGLPTFDHMFCANMIHIAPWEAALGYAQGAAHLIKSGGSVFLYGPFKEGKATAPSNLEFDRSLKSRNSAWGVRELESVNHIFADAGFNDVIRIVMPKNNLILKFSR